MIKSFTWNLFSRTFVIPSIFQLLFGFWFLTLSSVRKWKLLVNDFPTTWILATDCYSREFKQRRGRRQWSVQSIKKNKLASFQTLLRLPWNPLNLSYVGGFSRIELNSFKRTLFPFKNRKDKSSWYVPVLHKTTHYERFHVVESSSERQRDVLNRVIHVQSQCCFAHKTNCLFFDVVIVVVTVAWAPIPINKERPSLFTARAETCDKCSFDAVVTDETVKSETEQTFFKNYVFTQSQGYFLIKILTLSFNLFMY